MVKKTRLDNVFDLINNLLLFIVIIIMLYPFLNILAVSFSSYAGYIKNPMRILPDKITFDAFRYVFLHPLIWNSYTNTIIVTILGTMVGLLLTVTTAYPLSSNEFKGKKVIMPYIIFTMLFNGGIIPSFYLIKSLGLLDSLWALIIPGSLTAFNVFLMKNFFESIPFSLKEAATIDGASDVYILFKIIIPLSMPIIATIALFLSVFHWNSFFNAVLYIRSTEYWTIQLLLREIVLSSSNQLTSTGGNLAEMGGAIPTESIKYATLVVVIIPILCVYPFLQKYFVKGVMIGAVKG